MSIIAVVTSSPPLARGGHLVMADALVGALREAGHEADLIVTPQNRFGRNVSTYLSNWMLDAGRTGDGRRVDQVISLRWPSYAVRHPVHVCWLNHTMREYYDLWPQFRARLSGPSLIKESLRRTAIRRADTWLLRRLTARFTISETVRQRLLRFNGVDAEALHPPPPPRAYRCESYEPFLFTVSRLAPLKRLELLIEALARPVAAGIRCVVAGEGECATDLQRLVAHHGLSDRIELVGRIDDEALVDYLARCRAVAFVPRDEDYGFVTIEAFASAKPVITTTDSGGPAELVRSGTNGFVVEPTPDALAGALRQVMEDPQLAQRLGAAGEQVARSMTWQAAVERLVCV
ncbi:MAG TPA: glycosyltransferase family 4 protein [Vicinamibacterales bacterium]|nr:glycosyltransferase family 4 protein [Vicinamibacterales bacterium]